MIFAGATASFSNETCILIEYFHLDEKRILICSLDLISRLDTLIVGEQDPKFTSRTQAPRDV